MLNSRRSRKEFAYFHGILDTEYVFHVFQMVLRELRIRGNTWEYVGIHEVNTEYAHTRRMAMYSMGIQSVSLIKKTGLGSYGLVS